MASTSNARERARQSIRRSSRLISFLTLLLLPATITLWVEKADVETVGRFWFWTVIVIIFGIQAVVFLFIDRKASEEVPDLVFEHDVLEERIERLKIQGDELSESLKNTIAAQTVGRVWAATQTHLQIHFQAGGTLRDACRSVMNPLLLQADKLFSWTYRDIWTITVYRWSEERRLLEPVWWRRANGHPSGNAEPRKWQDGEGHCGTAFMSQETLFTDDLDQPSILNRVRPAPGNIREYDQATYRSFATVPLTIASPSGEVRLGVVALSSNEVGRFGESNVSTAEQLGDVLAQAIWLSELAEAAAADYGAASTTEVDDDKVN